MLFVGCLAGEKNVVDDCVVQVGEEEAYVYIVREGCTAGGVLEGVVGVRDESQRYVEGVDDMWCLVCGDVVGGCVDV